MKSYTTFLIEQGINKKVVFTFGRMNPPTRGHEEMVNVIQKYAKQNGADAIVFLSVKHDPKKNPLTPEQKKKYFNLSFPGVQLVIDPAIRMPGEAVEWLLAKKGYNNLIMLPGGDRVEEFNRMKKYFLDRPEKYNINDFKILSSGNRTSISASVQRKAVEAGNVEEFLKGVPSKLSKPFALEMFNDLKTEMGVK